VVRIALRQHVPLRASVEYPQYSFENTSGRDRPASRTSIGDVLFRKMIPDALPLLVCQPNHPTFIADRLRLAILVLLRALLRHRFSASIWNGFFRVGRSR